LDYQRINRRRLAMIAVRKFHIANLDSRLKSARSVLVTSPTFGWYLKPELVFDEALSAFRAYSWAARPSPWSDRMSAAAQFH